MARLRKACQNWEPEPCQSTESDFLKSSPVKQRNNDTKFAGRKDRRCHVDPIASRVHLCTTSRQVLHHDCSGPDIRIARRKWLDPGRPLHDPDLASMVTCILTPGPSVLSGMTTRSVTPGLLCTPRRFGHPRALDMPRALYKEVEGPGTAEMTCNVSTMKFSIRRCTPLGPPALACLVTSRALDSN